MVPCLDAYCCYESESKSNIFGNLKYFWTTGFPRWCKWTSSASLLMIPRNKKSHSFVLMISFLCGVVKWSSHKGISRLRQARMFMSNNEKCDCDAEIWVFWNKNKWTNWNWNEVGFLTSWCKCPVRYRWLPTTHTLNHCVSLPSPLSAPLFD